MQNTGRITPRRQIRPLAIAVAFGVLGYFALAKLLLSAVTGGTSWLWLGDVGANVPFPAVIGAVAAAIAAIATATGTQDLFATGGLLAPAEHYGINATVAN